jgi:hypothetical protein
MFQTAFQPNAFQNNAFQINVEPVGGDDGGHWTPEELRKVQKLHQKIAERQRKLEQATKDANANRKQAFKDQIDPVAKVKQSKVQSIQEVKADIPSVDTQESARLQAELRMLEAKRLEELDDEESILILLH